MKTGAVDKRKIQTLKSDFIFKKTEETFVTEFVRLQVKLNFKVKSYPHNKSSRFTTVKNEESAVDNDDFAERIIRQEVTSLVSEAIRS